MARSYKRLEIYKLGYNLTLKLYEITDDFPEHERNNIVDQIRRAAISVPLNIAEGTSRGTKAAFLQFFQYSYGSMKELQVLVDLSKDLNYINQEIYDEVYEEIDKLSRKLFLFIKNVEREKFFNWFKK